MSKNIYSMTLTFSTDRPISEEELETLKMQAMAQIEEPVTADGDDVDYTTKLIETDEFCVICFNDLRCSTHPKKRGNK
jgi:hypothetical protein